MAPPIYVKGGQWTNVEDQILRAAVSKYGLTQWARVASLLPKKTAKQAKARWNEYLNPSIKKDDWSPEEDEKLLGLVKLLPNQWRSISPIMGRTPTQCVDRYQQLLDRAMGNKDEDEELDDLKLSGHGIETLPALGNAFESLPSRPDLEDMDEDELEMLSEAKARLANTVGKKAKRKERERMLQENRRITLLEKRRDLKASGVRMSLELRNKKKRNDFDYNADIPHEHAPPPGLYDTTGEDAVNDRERLSFQERVKFKGVDAPEEKVKKPKSDGGEERAKKRQRQELSDAAKLFSDAADQDLKRRKLVLPAPGTTQRTEERVKEAALEASLGSLLSKEDLGSKKRLSEPMQKSSMKRLREFIKSMFSKIPPPKNNIEPKLPQIDKTIEAFAAGLDNDEDLEDLDLKPEQFRSLASIRGLTVPNPHLLKEIDPNLSEAEKAIAADFQALIKADYKQSVDTTYDAASITPLKPADQKNVLSLIDIELKNSKQEKLPASDFSLPKTKEAKAKVLQAINDLHEASDNLDAHIDRRSAEYNGLAREKYDAIVNLAQQLVDENQNVAILQKVLDLEEISLEERSAQLHDLVESVDLARSEVEL